MTSVSLEPRVIVAQPLVSARVSANASSATALRVGYHRCLRS